MNYDEMYNNLVNVMDNVDDTDDAKPIEKEESTNSRVVCRFNVYQRHNVTRFYGYLNRLIRIRNMSEHYLAGLTVPQDSNLGYFTLSDVFLMLDPKRLYTTDPRILCWY